MSTKTLEPSLFDELFDAEPVAIVEPEPVQITVPTAEDEAHAIDHVKAISDRLFQRSADIVDGSLHFADLDPDTMHEMDGPPDEWVLEVGEAEAKKRFRLAKAAWRANKDMPGGIKLAADFMAAEMKARSEEKKAPAALNVAFITLNQPQPNFPRRIVESAEGDDK